MPAVCIGNSRQWLNRQIAAFTSLNDIAAWAALSPEVREAIYQELGATGTELFRLIAMFAEKEVDRARMMEWLESHSLSKGIMSPGNSATAGTVTGVAIFLLFRVCEHMLHSQKKGNPERALKGTPGGKAGFGGVGHGTVRLVSVKGSPWSRGRGKTDNW